MPGVFEDGEAAYGSPVCRPMMTPLVEVLNQVSKVKGGLLAALKGKKLSGNCTAALLPSKRKARPTLPGAKLWLLNPPATLRLFCLRSSLRPCSPLHQLTAPLGNGT